MTGYKWCYCVSFVATGNEYYSDDYDYLGSIPCKDYDYLGETVSVCSYNSNSTSESDLFICQDYTGDSCGDWGPLIKDNPPNGDGYVDGDTYVTETYEGTCSVTTQTTCTRNSSTVYDETSCTRDDEYDWEYYSEEWVTNCEEYNTGDYDYYCSDTKYECPNGWSYVSGSGSSMVCSKPASTN